MVNYGNGKIYRIINIENETIYIGSTCQNLAKRLSTHKHRGNGNKIILIENYACNCREELIMREQQVIEEYSNLLNKQRAYISPEQKKEQKKEYYEANKERIAEYKKEYDKEYREANRDKLNEQSKEYYEANKDKIKEQSKEYYEANRDKIKEYSKEYREANKDKLNEYSKEYREANKDKLNEYSKEYREANRDKMKEYREANKDKISAKNREKVKCEFCDREVQKCSLKRHQKETKKCLKAQNKL